MHLQRSAALRQAQGGHERRRMAAAALVVAAAFLVVVEAQQQPPRPNIPSGVLLEPLGTTGEAIYPAFEGWGPLKDGTNVLLLGYFNRNKEAADVPIGPDNRIEPGGPDYGQPTHFRSEERRVGKE